MFAVPPAAQRPNLPIISVTKDERVANQLALMYANSAFVRDYSVNQGIDLARELKESGYYNPFVLKQFCLLRQYL